MGESTFEEHRIVHESHENSSPETSQGRILVVDDHPTFRRGLVGVFADVPDLAVCGEAENLVTALNAMRQLKPEIAIVDISLPGANGIELIKAMLSESPRLLVLVLSMHDESHFAMRAFRAGAQGYIMKSEPSEQIIAAVRRIQAGGLYVSLRLADRLIFKAIQSIDAGLGSTVDNLSDRELEVFQHLGKGYGTQEIANLLKLSAKTVETHRAHIKEKLGCNHASEVIRFAIDWVTREEG